MKILLTGSIQAGKTTLLDHLRLQGIPNVGFITEIAREVLTKNPELETDPRFQDILFDEQKKREQVASRHDVVICDRGAIDIVAHSKIYGHPIKKEWIEWSKTYDTVCLLSINDIAFDPSVYPPIRDWHAFRKALDEKTVTTLKELSVPFFILSGGIEERTNRLTMVIQNELGNKEGRRGVNERL